MNYTPYRYKNDDYGMRVEATNRREAERLVLMNFPDAEFIYVTRVEEGIWEGRVKYNPG